MDILIKLGLEPPNGVEILAQWRNGDMSRRDDIAATEDIWNGFGFIVDLLNRSKAAFTDGENPLPHRWVVPEDGRMEQSDLEDRVQKIVQRFGKDLLPLSSTDLAEGKWDDLH